MRLFFSLRSWSHNLLFLIVASHLTTTLWSSDAFGACAPGTTYCVTSASDTGNAGASGSFSWAIAQANGNPGSTIGFDNAVFVGPNPTLTLSGTSAQTPRVSANVIIDGGNTPGLVINGNGQREILFVRPDDPSTPINVQVSNVTLANGLAQGGNGGGGGYGGGGGMGAGGAIFVGDGATRSGN